MPNENSEKILAESNLENGVKMGAKISNQINTNQQSNMALSAYCVITQNSSTINVNFA